MSTITSVAIVIPAYERPHELEACLRSVMAQSHQEWRAYVVDDGSATPLGAVVESLQEPRITYVRLAANTGGPATPRTVGVQSSNEPLIAFLDSDDQWRPQHLTDAIERLLTSSHVAVAGNATVNGARDVRQGSGPYFASLPGEIGLRQLIRRNWIITSSLLTHRTPLLRAMPFPSEAGTGIYEDYAVWLRLARQGSIGLSNRETVQYSVTESTSYSDTYAPVDAALRTTFADLHRWCTNRGLRLGLTDRLWMTGVQARMRTALMVRSLRTVGSDQGRHGA